ncbi:MAG: hypothetical protein ACYCYM_00815 [Saccharofermentanales bacterium]
MQELIHMIFIISITIPVILIVYIVLPGLYVSFSKDRFSFTDADKEDMMARKLFSRIPIPDRFKKNILSKLHESGIGDSRTWMYWIILTVFLPFISAAVMIAGGYRIITAVCIASCCFTLPNLYIRSRISERQNAFLINAYKLYYFLHSQISSGIKSTDAVRGLHSIADHPLIHGTFVRFVAQYELTLNIEESLDVIRKAFKGYDAEMLCVSIRQCVETGIAGKTLLKMEQLMFAKYFYLLQKDTARYKTRLLIAGLFVMTPLVILFALPIVYDAVKGFGQVLNSSFS